MIRHLLRILLLPALVGAFCLSPVAHKKVTQKEHRQRLAAHDRHTVQDNSISRRNMIDTRWKGILTTSIGAALVWKTNPPAFAAQATRPLLRCLVSVLRIQQLSTELSNQLENSGEQVIEVNSGVKYMIKDLDMRLNVEEGTLYLVDGKREEARRHGQEALEYLSQIVEFDAYDELKKSRSSKYALVMTPEKREFTRKAFQAAQRELKQYLSFFPRDKVKEAELFYNQVFEPTFPED